uniref:Uncharacterized protein n=1 Tax=Arundo donax TaxID=35708 RepID=A0A0A9E6X0_ARUDO
MRCSPYFLLKVIHVHLVHAQSVQYLINLLDT